MPNWLEAANASPGSARPVLVMGSGPPQVAPPFTQDTSMAPLLPTTNKSVWLATPNWGEVASGAPAGAKLGWVIGSGPCQVPAPSTQDTLMALVLSTTHTSVWLATPNWA